ncbi:MAG: hypothetical protein HY786_09510 [Deltaproteobacteria bacterium]|nr:hypothetical protein [Deltaproteobacteria bacterium]
MFFGDDGMGYKVMSEKEIKEIRENGPAAAGGRKITSMATDKEIELLANINYEIGGLHNRILALEKIKNNVLKSMEKR